MRDNSTLVQAEHSTANKVTLTRNAEDICPRKTSAAYHLQAKRD